MSDGWGVRDMKRRCQESREDCLALERATPAELDAYWPGGTENTLPGLGGWIYCWAQYSGFLRRGESDVINEHDQETANDAALAAFRDDPVPVELVRPLPDGTAYLAVYPKSTVALSLLDSIDSEIRWLQERILWLQRRWERDAVEHESEFLQTATLMELYAVWICTTEGPGVPFNAFGDWPAVPVALQQLETLDIINVLRAHHTANRTRIELVAATLAQRGGEGRRVSWATLQVRAADTLRVPMDHLIKTRSLASWFAQVAMKWADDQTQRDARQPTTATSGMPGLPTEAI